MLVRQMLIAESVDKLKKNGVLFKCFNNGNHIRVENLIDFWPTTGLWMVCENYEKGRGLNSLMEKLILITKPKVKITLIPKEKECQLV